MTGPHCYWCYTAIPDGYPCPNPDCISHVKDLRDREKKQAANLERIADSLEKIVELLIGLSKVEVSDDN